MPQPLALESFAHSGLAEHFYAGVLKDAGPYSLLAIGPRLCFQHNRVDPFEMQQVREHQSRGTGSYNADLCLEPRHALPVILPEVALPEVARSGFPWLRGMRNSQRERLNRWRNASAPRESLLRLLRCSRQREGAGAVLRYGSMRPSGQS